MRVVAVLAVAALAAGACTDDSGTTATTAQPTTTAPPPGGSWPSSGFDSSNSGFNPDETVLTPENVDGLTEIWWRKIGNGPTTTPVVRDGVVYVTGSSKLHAVDLASGEPLWSTEQGIVYSSPTLDGDAIYTAFYDAALRLDRATGEERWRATIVEPENLIPIPTSSPVVAGNLVLFGTATGTGGGRPGRTCTLEEYGDVDSGCPDYTFRGSVVALDTETGSERWRLWLTDDNEMGGAGVGVASTVAIDEELGLGFVATVSSFEPPAAPLSRSVVALDLETGEVAWSTQFDLGDPWDVGDDAVHARFAGEPNLWGVDGRKLLGISDSSGTYHALDRETGEIVWETTLTAGATEIRIASTAAVADGHVFVGANHASRSDFAWLYSLDAATGGVEWVTKLDGAIRGAVSATPGLVYVGTDGHPSKLRILDAADGTELWSLEVPGVVYGGASIVDGVVYWGYDRATQAKPGYGFYGALLALALDADSRPPTTAPARVSVGAALYGEWCRSCHGARGQGRDEGPSLIDIADRLTLEETRTVVREGRGQMPALDGLDVSEREIELVVDYIRNELGD